MTYPISSQFYAVANGTSSSNVFITYLASRDPTSGDINFPITKRWVNIVSGNEFILVNLSITNGGQYANWLKLASSSPILATWNFESANFSALAGNGYITTGTLIAELPDSPNLGDTIYFIMKTPTLTIQVLGDTIIEIGIQSTSSNGTCVGNEDGSSITLVFGSTWEAMNSPQGTFILN